MSDLTTDKRAVAEQYRTPSNLQARMAIHSRFSTNPGFRPWVYEHMLLSKGMRVLEIGCGSGELWARFKDRIPADCRIELTDLSPGMVDASRQRLGADPRFAFSTMDAEEIDREHDAYDLVLANHMLYHVPRRERAFEGIARILKSSGRLVATTNGPAHLRELRAVAARFGVVGWLKTSDRAFGLANGEAQLAPWFSVVETLRYYDGLRVTDAQAIVDYILSAHDSATVLGPAGIDALRACVEDEIREKGCFAVTKEQGMFVATGPRIE